MEPRKAQGPKERWYHRQTGLALNTGLKPDPTMLALQIMEQMQIFMRLPANEIWQCHDTS
jgi:hypothetical protein